MINCLKKENIEWIAMIMCRIWLRRNILIFENKFYSPKQVIQMANEGLEDYKSAQMSSTGSREAVVSHGLQKKWKKPGLDVVQANWDATLDMENKKMRVGIVFQDEEGEVLASVCDVKQHVDNLAVAESMTLWRAIEMCRELSFSYSKVIFEGDATVVINRINKEGED
ncbi:uncharacterized protein LOC121252406 [Juglans microcarpa x Juglans regia]|uniref:uncharacterized protein LOC121252406 n=1 Tax=Juglans microcarpa x Juglans regia TaxID=2249226 RepID=UPI001B7E2402|nr:uncharacterized protein LOC121252406 [Juglans microcarpa x Juglans regia]